MNLDFLLPLLNLTTARSSLFGIKERIDYFIFTTERDIVWKHPVVNWIRYGAFWTRLLTIFHFRLSWQHQGPRPCESWGRLSLDISGLGWRPGSPWGWEKRGRDMSNNAPTSADACLSIVHSLMCHRWVEYLEDSRVMWLSKRVSWTSL